MTSQPSLVLPITTLIQLFALYDALCLLVLDLRRELTMYLN